MNFKSLETLEVWKKAKEFALRISREVLSVLPVEENWNLNQQLRRSASKVKMSLAQIKWSVKISKLMKPTRPYSRFSSNDYRVPT